MNLSDLQDEAREWRARNFPGNSTQNSFMGMVEEMGEISHHLLKREQGIRGEEEYHTSEIIDGVCDLIIFATGLADSEDFDLGEALQSTWDKVKQRDWVSNPETGADE